MVNMDDLLGVNSTDNINLDTNSTSSEEVAVNNTKPKKEKKKKKKKNSEQNKEESVEYPEQLLKKKKKDEGIKTLPLIFLILMTGSTLIPAVLYASDYIGAFLQKQNIMGNIGYRFGIGPSPKKRIVSFYEKHDPSKLGQIDGIMAKHYGEYPKLVKKLERKYHDYGYFLNWEKDEAPMTLAKEQLKLTMEQIGDQFDLYAPRTLKTAARNAKYNILGLYKKGNKVWRKQVWPLLEPYFGVPDERAAREQKRKDAKQAKSRKPKKGGRSREFRDD